MAADGRELATIEGLGADGLSTLQRALVEECHSVRLLHAGDARLRDRALREPQALARAGLPCAEGNPAARAIAIEQAVRRLEEPK